MLLQLSVLSATGCKSGTILDGDPLGDSDRQRGDDERRWRMSTTTMMMRELLKPILRGRFLETGKHGEEERDHGLPRTRENRRSWLREKIILELGFFIIIFFRTVLGWMSWWMMTTGELWVCLVECGQNGHDHGW